jgi:hypothetical protein
MTIPIVRLWLALVAMASLGAQLSRPIPPECTLAAKGEGRFQLTVKNISAVPLDGEFFPAVALASASPGSVGRYWAPIDLKTGRPYGPNQPRRVTLQRGQATTVVVAPETLLWDRTVSSAWPSRPLSEVVPAGRYALYFDLGERETAGRTSSNRLVVVLQDGVLRVDPRDR